MQPNFSASLSLKFQFKTCMVRVLKMYLLFLLSSLTHSVGCKKKKVQFTIRTAEVEKLGCKTKIAWSHTYYPCSNLFSKQIFFVKTEIRNVTINRQRLLNNEQCFNCYIISYLALAYCQWQLLLQYFGADK